MKKIKTQLFQRTYRLFRRTVRWEKNEHRTDEDKLRAKAQFEALYDFIVDSGLEQEYCEWSILILFCLFLVALVIGQLRK